MDFLLSYILNRHVLYRLLETLDVSQDQQNFSVWVQRAYFLSVPNVSMRFQKIQINPLFNASFSFFFFRIKKYLLKFKFIPLSQNKNPDYLLFYSTQVVVQQIFFCLQLDYFITVKYYISFLDKYFPITQFDTWWECLQLKNRGFLQAKYQCFEGQSSQVSKCP